MIQAKLHFQMMVIAVGVDGLGLLSDCDDGAACWSDGKSNWDTGAFEF